MAHFTAQFGFRNGMNASIKMDSTCFRKLLKELDPAQSAEPDYATPEECMLLLTHCVQNRTPRTINGLGVSAWIDFAQVQLVACSITTEGTESGTA